jgi:hypothetical protein
MWFFCAPAVADGRNGHNDNSWIGGFTRPVSNDPNHHIPLLRMFRKADIGHDHLSRL